MADISLSDQMTQAAAAFLESLSPDQRTTATRAFDDSAERFRWYYTPNARPGVSLVELDATQRQRARRLLRAGMSETGFNTAATIMGVESILGAREGFAERPYALYAGPSPSIVRDPEMYFVCIFGEPGAEKGWGWAFGGHHISVNHTIAGGRVARATPSFLGSNPARSPLGGHDLRPLAPEQDLGFALLASLTPGQRGEAVLSDLPPADIMQANRPMLEDLAVPRSVAELMGTPENPRLEDGFRRATGRAAFSADELAPLRFKLESPTGARIGALGNESVALAGELIRRYLSRYPEATAEAEWGRLRTTLDDVHFAWAGATEPGAGHYYRLHGHGLLIEYDNTQDGANHIHACLRDPSGDFGADLLGAHYAASH